MVSAAGIAIVGFVLFFMISILGVLIWLLFQGDLSVSTIIETLGKVLLFPFQVILRVFGVSPNETPAPPPAQECPVDKPNEPVQVVEHQVSNCPPCELKCPETPICQDTKPMELEIQYLKDMLKFVGTICQRENAINEQFRELYPGFSIMSPEVKRLTMQYQFLKNQIREDETQYTYFKNYFTKLTGIPSSSSAVHSTEATCN